ncbi:ACP S-malonyltransferase [Amycolatopsis sp. OK19-0408]|uniref:Malonyl CoA-acyl carrier protein transacylase n=1 Tax=Amycolatopsis iheyensis TaxID=2945988 RepID=A0A9X2SNY1_9PSEU|nr:ACP S-malonyltransferase [Amycolatopsis iheyensis]MCR6488453.1 ACP S-malonyltransferase [Amycolatopsis iheyensis]
MRAFVFPGQGSQRRGMGRGLFERFPDVARQADDVLGYSVEELCRADPGRRLSRTEYAQPAIYVVNALHHRAASPAADYLAGHSLGEYNALLAAGAFDFVTGLTLVRHRAELMGRCAGGGMAAVVGVPQQVIEETLAAHDAAGVVIANHNAPEQFVLAGPTAELDRLRAVFEGTAGVRGFVPLRVGGAFHSPLMEPAAEAFRVVLDSVTFDELRTPVVTNVTGLPYASGGDAIRAVLAAQVIRPVRWADGVRYLRDAGVTDFVEAGGGKVLTSLIGKVLAEDPRTAPWREYRDERISALLRDGVAGKLTACRISETIHAGGPPVEH